MSKSIWSIAAAVAACALIPAGPAGADKDRGKGNSFSLDARREVLPPVSYGNLTLMPVVAKKPAKKPRDVMVLDEGMKAGKVKIIEKGDGGSVNQLVLVNRSDDPLFLMAGEVIIGGKQDRIIGKDTIVPPKSREEIGVFCVEHGRWSGRKADFSTAESLAHTELRKKAKFQNQSEVWSEVSKKNAKRATENSTDTYRQIARGKKTKKAIAGYEKHFTRALRRVEGRDRMVGYVVAIGDRVVAVETFSSPALFRKLEGKLLASYFVEAVDAPQAKGKVVAPSVEKVTRFRDKARRARAKQRKVVETKGGKTYQFSDDGVVGSSVKADEAAAESLYESAYAE